ncbi:hypothetical protein FLP10_15175 [Agromyces intestinalis]|uniref:DUF6575 domain-containing protein n=1 Tax=Agromyces intestinalis TaxID=2592652 RepID=A0A5C1YI25_9MICO|nr:DUF6575 domain-containing protein [Agromyces intestinalis]QEO15621.1 hypothetical protein FLP10_15175 [Agromyces intestinalis]
MSWISGTPMGEVDVIEVLVEYDGPRVVIAQSTTDQYYLAGWAKEASDADTWLFVPISRARIPMVRSGGVDLRSAFTHPEGVVYILHIPLDEVEPIAFEIANGTHLPEEWLPDKDYRLDLPTPTLPPAADGPEIERLARQEGRARFRLRVHMADKLRSEAPTRRIGELLVAAQNVFDNIGYSQIQAAPSQSGRIPKEIVGLMATDLVGVSAASFVVELGSADGVDLFGDSPFTRAASTLVDLLAVDLPGEELISMLADLRPRGAKSFRNFVNELAATGADVTVAVAGVADGYRAADLSAEQVDNLRALLNQILPDDALEIRGRMRLYRFDMARKLFGLKDLFDGADYEGAIASRALPQMDHATSNAVYDVVITATVQFDQAVGDRKPRYVLEQLVESESEVPLQATVEVIDSAGTSLPDIG